MTALAALLGARVRRIDAPSADLWAITLAAGDLRGTLVVSLARGAAGVGWLEKRPHGAPASSFVQKLRKELEGGRVRAFEAETGCIALRIGRAERELALAFEADGGVVLFEGERAIIRASAAADGGGRGLTWPETLEAAAAQGEALLAGRAGQWVAEQRGALLRAVGTARKKLARKLEAQRGDAARVEQVPELRRRAQLLLSQLHAVPRGAKSVRLLDYGVDPPEWLELSLDVKLGAREQAELWFKQAKRFERGAALALQRVAGGESELARFEALREEIEAAESAEELAEIGARAAQIGVRAEGGGGAGEGGAKKKEPPRRVPFRTFVASGGRKVLVGKGAADNDKLTLEFARPHDLWLHARDVSGAHVVVPLEKTETCPPELLIDAAHLAAHFSDSRGEQVVDVAHTQRRYVRKPRGAAIGSVIVEKEKVLRLQVEQARLLRLLAAASD
ncbi:MAG TPA: NFACT RNA binding domain-containing protein [Polyangiales bacterium]|nr:NFACT RNA binding domain-containing protein [Polyangiales bacterium]